MNVRFLFFAGFFLLFSENSRAQAVDNSEASTQAAVAHGETKPHPHPYFPDVILKDQNGKDQRLYSDLMKGKVVVINSFFATCDGVCPVLANNMAKVQEWLGDRLGKEAHLLSLTVDPEKDTPALLESYATRFKAKPGWYFLTGDKNLVEQAARKLGQYTPNKEGHTNIIIVGNETTGLWKKVMGMAPAEEIIKAVESVINDKG